MKLTISAYERDVRDRLDRTELSDHTPIEIEIGVLRGLLADINMWRKIAYEAVDHIEE